MATTVLLVIGGLFLLVGAGLVVLGRDPGRQALAAELWRLYRTEVGIVGFLLLPAYLGEAAFGLAVAAIAALAQGELLAALVPDASPRLRLGSGVAGACLVAVAHGGEPPRAWAIAVALVACALAADVLREPAPPRLGRLARVALTFVYPPMFLAFLVWLRARPEGFQLVALLFGTVETCDSFALLCGKVAGTRPVFPTLSPGKTVAGLGGGLLAGAAAGVTLGALGTSLDLAQVMLCTGVALAATLVGDLAASKIKRNLGRKDFGRLVAGQGGVLDIYDTVTFAAPAFYWVVASG